MMPHGKLNKVITVRRKYIYHQNRKVEKDGMGKQLFHKHAARGEWSALDRHRGFKD